MANLKKLFLLLLSFTSGSFLTWMVTMSTLEEYKMLLQERAKMLRSDDDSFTTRAGVLQDVTHPTTSHAIRTQGIKSKTLHNPDLKTNKTRVLCWVLTSPSTLQTRAIGIKETWGPRCDVILYMSSETDPEFPTVGLDVKEGRPALWNKTRAAIMYIYKHHFNDADWFMKADDDTYVIMENLRDFLQDKDSGKPVYYGHHFKPYIPQGYLSGGAGYVMSREALRAIVVNQLEIPLATPSCEYYKTIRSEDVRVGLCMQMAGVTVGDSRDDQNKNRFLPLTVESFFTKNVPEWFNRFSKHKTKLGPECCSESLISIHYVTDRASMQLLDYYIYRLRRNKT
ncbi:glycoprotein-N-acetylgalactosamine 3-beta-galactosyltransferase 1-like [Asterias rubens]|uniref:glycoprotein-N-acetylgalactosamine 3-beta-galactosyltransferase 1-like n=1 Tax=Asterias rubens TaxID=7604 RepID=UPI0014556CD3|nr:glycoprotein-N-acetylgalactosamine 3-beta-galactosyltransferase 1-like [Asterias rubens]